MLPLPGALVRYLQGFSDAVKGHAVAHEPYGRHPVRQPAAGMLEERSCKRAVLAPAAEALSISVRHSARGRRAWCARTRMAGSRNAASAKVSKPVCLRQRRPAVAFSSWRIFCSSASAMRVQEGFSRTMILTILLRPGGHPAKPSPNTEPGGLQGTFSIWHVELYHLGCQDSLNRPPFT